MIVCKSCDGLKPRDLFWKNEKRCKPCLKIKYKEYLKTAHGRATRRKINLKYARSEKGAANSRRNGAAYRLRKPDDRWYRMREKLQARNAVDTAIRAGKLKRLPCAVCGNPKSQGHHEDYTKQLDVAWLCSKHHAEKHPKT